MAAQACLQKASGSATMQVSLLAELWKLESTPCSCCRELVCFLPPHSWQTAAAHTSSLQSKQYKHATMDISELGSRPVSPGSTFRRRYIAPCDTGNTSACLLGASTATDYGVVGPGVGFNHYNSLMRSSGLDRTLTSAQSYLAGMFPPRATVSATTYLPTGQQVRVLPWRES